MKVDAFWKIFFCLKHLKLYCNFPSIVWISTPFLFNALKQFSLFCVLLRYVKFAYFLIKWSSTISMDRWMNEWMMVKNIPFLYPYLYECLAKEVGKLNVNNFLFLFKNFFYSLQFRYCSALVSSGISSLKIMIPSPNRQLNFKDKFAGYLKDCRLFWILFRFLILHTKSSIFCFILSYISVPPLCLVLFDYQN